MCIRDSAYGYDKLEDAAEFKSIIEGNTEYTTDDTVNQANIDALGIKMCIRDSNYTGWTLCNRRRKASVIYAGLVPG